MSFSDEKVSYEDTAKRTGAAYVKFTDDYRVVLRMLDSKAKTVWKHFIREANGGRGMGAVCPNVTAGLNICPIEKAVAHLEKDDPIRRAENARRRFIVNVLDRTPYTTCLSCGTETPGKVCINKSCGKTLAKNDFKPLNKVKILEQGPQLFNQVLNGVEKLYEEEFHVGITEYDITFTSQGKDRDRRINAIPQPPVPFNGDWLLDPETGEPQKLYDLDLLSEPTPVEQVEAMLRGATIEELNTLRGIN